MVGITSIAPVLLGSALLFSTDVFAQSANDRLEGYKKGAKIAATGACDNGKSPLVVLAKNPDYFEVIIFSPALNANKTFFQVKKDLSVAHNEYFIKDYAPNGVSWVRAVPVSQWIDEIKPLSLNFWYYIFSFGVGSDCSLSAPHP